MVNEQRSPRWLEAVRALVVLLVLWLLVATWLQHGLRSLVNDIGAAWMLFLLLFWMAVGVSAARRRSPNPLIVALVLSTIAWFYFTGSLFHAEMFGWDLLGLLVGLAAFYTLHFIVGRIRRQKVPSDVAAKRRPLKFVVALFCGWVGIDIVSVTRPALPLQNSHMKELPSAEEHKVDGLRIGLALSGGGYRAAVFHAGVLNALDTIGIKPTVISMVSGGSIIGAFYSLGGSPEDFKTAIADGRLSLKHDLLLPHNLVRLAFPFTVPLFNTELFPWYSFSRRNVQAELLDRVLYRNPATPVDTKGPSIAIASTDLTFANAIVFLNDGLLGISPDGHGTVYRGDSLKLPKSYSLGDKVSISGAFPFAFPPEIIHAQVGSMFTYDSGYVQRTLRLVDGGIADNSGYEVLVALNSSSCENMRRREQGKLYPSLPHRQDACVDKSMTSDLIIVSDAGAIFGIEQELSSMSTLSRAFDIQFAHAKRPAFKELKKSPDNVVVLSPQEYYSPSSEFHKKSSMVGFPDMIIDQRLIYITPGALSTKELDRLVDLLSNTSNSARLQKSRERYRQAKEQSAQLCSQIKDFLTRMQCEFCPACEEAKMLGLDLGMAVSQLLDAFRDTSTLDDQLSSARVDELFRLGEVLVYMNVRDIEKQVADATTARAK